MISDKAMILRLCLSAVLGGLIGLERERLNWAAGLRTHMLVSVGSTLFMLVSAFGFHDILGTAHVGSDPSRVAAQVVSGIGFLGAGTIVLRREAVRGLTTAASLWTVAAVGLAVGGGMYVAAGAATVILLGILAGLKPLEGRLFKEKPSGIVISLVFSAERSDDFLTTVSRLASDSGLKVGHITFRAKTPQIEEVLLHLPSAATPEAMASFLKAARALPGIVKVRVKQASPTGKRATHSQRV